MRKSTIITKTFDAFMLYALQKENPLRFLMLSLAVYVACYISAITAFFFINILSGIAAFISITLISRPFIRHFSERIDRTFRDNPLRF